MTLHKFKVGQAVVFDTGIFSKALVSSYRVSRCLPETVDGEPQYRIQSSSEPHERVVRESALS